MLVIIYGLCSSQYYQKTNYCNYSSLDRITVTNCIELITANLKQAGGNCIIQGTHSINQSQG